MGVYKNVENYLRGLCIVHPAVAHTTVVAGHVRNSFFRINAEEELTAATFNNIDYPAVAFISLSGRIADTDNALWDIRHVLKNGWLFIDHVKTNVDEDGIGNADRIQTAFDITFSVMEDFIKAMKDDYEINDRCGVFEKLDLNKINYVQVGPVQQNEYGWILYFDSEFKAERIIDGSDGEGGYVPPLNPYRIDPEIIYIINEDSKTVPWTTLRKNRFGLFPIVEVWLQDDSGVLYLAPMQPTVDAAPPDFTTMSFLFSGLENGFIILR